MLVKEELTTYYPIPTMTTCYIHLNCTRDTFIWCLDWREVCDGKVDCWPKPVDEENCEQLEENECVSNEYRCFNGQCIPDIFLNDDALNPDCLDRTDEDLFHSLRYPSYCQNILYNQGYLSAGDPALRCADIACAHWSGEAMFTGGSICGGSVWRSHPIETFDRHLFSITSNAHISQECWATMVCHVQATSRVFLVSI